MLLKIPACTVSQKVTRPVLPRVEVPTEGHSSCAAQGGGARLLRFFQLPPHYLAQT